MSNITTRIDEIEVTSLGIILYREVTETEDDGLIAISYHRISLTPGADTTGHPQEIIELCAATWTAEILNAFKNRHNIGVPS